MRDFLRQCRWYFVYAGLFSLFINLLSLTVPLFMLQVFDRVLTSRSHETLLMLTLVAAVGLLVHMALETLRSRLLLGAGVALDGMAAPPVLAGVLKTAARPGANSYVTGLRDVSTLRGFLSSGSLSALFDVPWVSVYLGVIFLFQPGLGVIATLGALTLFALAWLNERLTRKPLDEMNREARRAAHYIDAGVRNAEVVNALGMFGDLKQRWQRLNDRVIDAQVRAGRYAGVISGLTKFTRLLIQILMLGAGAKLVIDQEMTAGVMITGTLILARALAPVETAILTWKGLVDARDAYHRLNELLATRAAQTRVELPAPHGRLEIERVVFAIPGSDRPVLKGVSFALNPGESLGLIGPSASGKSTLARLATGLWRPTSGTVRLDGADITLWPREHLGPHLGYLPQDVELFAGTVGENIARLKEADAPEIIRAARRAYAHDMILRLAKGYDTEIGEGGAVLSGGQRQRIALARALFGNPRLVVLDEPNANLDSEGEQALLKAMNDLGKAGVTLIVISHRPSLLSQANKLLVLKDGQVECFGPRAEVMAKITRPIHAPAPAVPQLIAAGRPS